ncbi:hypothetical protein BJ138DRAFT_1124656 [Hygrophoropsis aurantiaca]|uniref:Uncharacterized protein n=1 Tax=Hygrophoropsis aurantiaca TaxID=72124 RepID=A0ACB8AIS3_9AGAM|nr:hypothetical protein BJ138DRAFT_1124656 [Hygrophoropsis aurantiaca]
MRIHKTYIPPEITDHVIDHLHIDTRMLGICSLVCKSWLPASRFHLFSTISLHPWKKDSFLRLLDSTYSSFAPYVRHLFIREGRGAYTWEKKWLNEALPLMTALTRIESLEIEQIIWEFLGTAAKKSFREIFREVKQLRLRQFEFRTGTELVDFLTAFPILETLRLENVKWEKETTQLLDASVPSRLRVVGMNYCRKGPVLDWLLTNPGVARVDTVRLGMITARDTPTVSRYLQFLGDSLTELHLHFCSEFYVDGAGLIDQFNLAQNTQLRKLYIYGLVVSTDAPLDWVTTLFRQIRSPHMREVSLSFHIADSLEDAQAVDWDGFVEVFAKPHFSGLSNVNILIARKGDCSAGKLVQRRLASLQQRRILSVNVGSDDRSLMENESA